VEGFDTCDDKGELLPEGEKLLKAFSEYIQLSLGG
jgi:hypothetical protein